MYRFFIKGVVQGVGFRPFVYNSCVDAGLTGYVQNTGSGVEVVVNDKEKFEDLLTKAPPLARVDSVSVEKITGEYTDFKIVESKGSGYAEVPPDLFLCEDCLRELRDPGDRRSGYFFITCTNCGPRFSMTKKNPYDRDTTAMEEFDMCDSCKAEYKDPRNRRYHAQTIACKECGPKVKLFSGGQDVGGISEAAKLLNSGEVLAIKGIGGFHLACLPSVVGKLRELTGRKNKPYALMAKDINHVSEFCYVGEKEKELLLGVERPIVLLSKKKEYVGVSELDTYGVMLPYTALHYLLLDKVEGPLVMTSSNMPEHPISTSADEQFVKHILDHDREIVNCVDDSVVKVVGGKKLFLRRSRGYVPRSIEVDYDKDILALGAEMNNTFCVVKDGKAVMSQYMGNTKNYDTFENYKKNVKSFLRLTGCKPTKILCDMHPGYNTTIYAEQLSSELGVEVVKVQHHLAHAYSVAVEHGLKEDFVSIVCDGLGYGKDGDIWGGEVFVNGKRVGHLEEQFQLGGDSATLNPAKMLMGIMYKFMTKEGAYRHLSRYFSEEEFEMLSKQLDERYNCPVTTSCGRVLDAVSVLLGVCDSRTYDGRPAMLLEALSSGADPYPIEAVVHEDKLMIIPLFKWLVLNLEKDKKRLAATVQYYIAKGLYKIASDHAAGQPIVFSGGAAYNRIMTEYMLEKGVLVNEKVPCGDGGVALGQVGYYLAKSQIKNR